MKKATVSVVLIFSFITLFVSNVYSEGTLRVNNNFSYSVGVEVDGLYSAHIPGGEHFYKDLCVGSHTVRVFNTSHSNTYNITIVDGSVTTVSHNSWQTSNGSQSAVEVIKVNNNLSYSVNVSVDCMYRAHVVGGEHWYLAVWPGTYCVRIWNDTHSVYDIATITSGNNFIINHNMWGSLVEGTLKVVNNLSYSVGVEVDGLYSAHIPGGEHFYKDLCVGSHTVRVFNTGHSSTYNITIVNGSVYTISHNSWQNSNGSQSAVEVLKVNNNLSYSVNVSVDCIYRAHVVGGEHWYLALWPGTYCVRIWNDTNSDYYSVTITNGNNYILNLATSVEETHILPSHFCLSQNYPNPFNPETRIRFKIPEVNNVTICIYNMRGEEVRRLVDKAYNAGWHHIQWDGCDGRGDPVPSGVYLYEMRAGSFKQIMKMTLIR